MTLDLLNNYTGIITEKTYGKFSLEAISTKICNDLLDEVKNSHSYYIYSRLKENEIDLAQQLIARRS